MMQTLSDANNLLGANVKDQASGLELRRDLLPTTHSNLPFISETLKYGDLRVLMNMTV